MAGYETSLRESIFWTTVRVVVASRTSKNLRAPEVGTAFVVNVGSFRDQRSYIVTPRHVVDDADDGSLIFFRKKADPAEPDLFEFRRRTLFGEMWIRPADTALDLAVTLFASGTELANAFIAAKTTALIQPIPEPALESWQVDGRLRTTKPFEEVLFAGYSEGFWDRRNGFPIVRRGVTATPTNSDYEGSPTFLLDGAVYPGSSGSPVMVIEPEVLVPSAFERQRYGKEVKVDERFAFLGMITEAFHRRGESEAYRNIGVVLKAREIFKFIREYERVSRPA